MVAVLCVVDFGGIVAVGGGDAAFSSVFVVVVIGGFVVVVVGGFVVVVVGDIVVVGVGDAAVLPCSRCL